MGQGAHVRVHERDTDEAARRFFLKAYTSVWDSRELPEDDMLWSALRQLPTSDAVAAREAFKDILKHNDGDIEKALVYDFGCQTKPYAQFGRQFKHANARQMLEYVSDFIDRATSSQPRPLAFDGTAVTETDGTLVATLNGNLGERAAAYGRLFVASKEIADFLEARIEATMTEYDAAFRDAEQFNSNPNEPHRGNVYTWRNRPYPDAPEWVTAGLALIAKIKGVDEKEG